MKRLERLVVHVEEAFRVLAVRDEARLRLALLLFDSAAELILHRESEYQLAWDEYPRQRLERFRRMEADGTVLPPELLADKAELEVSVLSNGQRKKIEREFDAKATYLECKGTLPPPIVRVLRKLHQYRNEAYHRDRLRAATLETAVVIYGFVVCELMRLVPVHGVGYSRRDFPLLAKYHPDPVSHAFEMMRIVADALELKSGFPEHGSVAAFLSEHLLDRLNGISEDLDAAARHIAEVQNDDTWDRVAVLHYLQVGDSWEEIFASPATLKKWEVPITPAVLQQCREQAEALALRTDPLACFSLFADIEDRFEALETEVAKMSASIEESFQLEFERQRGN